MKLETAPVGFLGFTNAKQASSGFGIAIFSLVRWKNSSLQARAVPPPLLAPGLGVDTYLIPLSSSNSSIASLCFLFSDCSQTSVRKHRSLERMAMSSASEDSLLQADLALYSVILGADSASTSLLHLLIVLLTGVLTAGFSLAGRCPVHTGIGELSSLSREDEELHIEMFPSS